MGLNFTTGIIFRADLAPSLQLNLNCLPEIRWKRTPAVCPAPSDTKQNAVEHGARKHADEQRKRQHQPSTERAREVFLRRQQQSQGSRYVFPGDGITGHIVTVQHAHERCIKQAGIQFFEFYCWRHTFGTRQAQAGVDKFSLAGLMGHSSPSVAERYYVHIPEPHVTAGFRKFEAYRKAQALLANKKLEAFPQRTEKVQ
jgi:integrase